MRDSIILIATQHMRRTAAAVDLTITGLIDHLNFFLAIQALRDWVVANEGAKEAEDHLNAGLAYALRYLPEARELFIEHFSLLAAEDPQIQQALRIATMGGGKEGVWNFCKAVVMALSRLNLKKVDLAKISDGEDLKRFRQIAAIAATESPAARLNACAGVIHKRNRRSKAWITKAASLAHAAPSDDEALVTAAAEARSAAAEMAVIEARIEGAADGEEEKVADLKIQKANLAAAIAAIAEASPNPSVIKAVAATERTTQTSHATEMGKKLGMTPEQEKAMMASGKAIIAAGAGSGKTRVLAGKVVDIITREGVRSDRIIATSFSKKSAAELKKRVLDYGGANLLDAGDDGFGTTHSVALKLLRQFSPQIANAKIMDSDAYLVKMAMKQVMLRPEYGSYPVDPEPVGMFDGLYQPDIQGDAPIDTGWVPEAVEAGPPPDRDSGKKELHTAIRGRWGLRGLGEWADGKGFSWGRSLIRFCDYITDNGLGPADLDDAAWQELKRILHTNSGASNIGRNRALNMSSDAFWQLMETSRANVMGKMAAGTKGRGKGSDKASRYWNEPANQWFNLGIKKMVDTGGRAIGVKRFSTAISKHRANLVTPSQAWAKEKDVFAAVYGAYDWLKHNDPVNAGQIDFDDMLVEACKMLVANPTARAMVQAKFTHVLVDEAQDLNRAQHVLFGLVTGYYDPQTLQPRSDGKMKANTFVFIGDDKQAIYEFRGATPDLFIERSDAFQSGEGQKGDFETHMLEMNFRSGSDIVDAANKLIAHNSKQIPMVCKANVDRKGKGLIHNVEVSTHEEGAAYTAEQIEEMIDGEGAIATPDDFGVAVRTNAEAYAFGVEMLKRGIPFRSKVSFFNDPTTQALVLWLKLAGSSNPKDINEVVLNAHRVPRFNLDKTFEMEIQKQARGQNYLEFLSGGGWRYIYTGDRQEWRNEKNVRPYVEALEYVHNLAGDPQDILNEILNLKGSEMFGERQTVIDSLIEKVKGSPEHMDMLSEESEDGSITDEAIKGLALAPIQPLMGLIGDYEDLGPALAFVERLQKANDKKHKDDNPDAADYHEPAVVIDTCHGWKGLETKHIFVPMAKGVFPHKASEGDEEQMASERRLAYVALTRGENSVTIINPMVTHTGQPGGVSQFVGEACIRPLGGEDVTAKQASLEPFDWQEMSLGDMGESDIDFTDYESWAEEQVDLENTWEGDLSLNGDPLAEQWKDTGYEDDLDPLTAAWEGLED